MAGFRKFILTALLLLSANSAHGSALQTPEDQADPSVVAEEMRHDKPPAPSRRRTIIESAPAPSVGVSQPVLIGAVRVEGASALSLAAFAPAIDPYLGRELSPQELQALATDIANVARKRGFGLATAWIPEQRIGNGILRVTIDEGRIDRVRVSGNAAAAVQRALSPVANGKPIGTAQLERQLLLAEDLAGVHLGKARLERSADGTVLLVHATSDRIEAYAYADNWGSSTAGPFRAQLSVSFNGLLTGDDRLSISGIITPVQPREFTLARLSYSKVLGASGTEVTFSGYHAVIHSEGVKGRSNYAEVGISQPLLRSRAASVWATVRLGLLNATQTREAIPVRDDRIAAIGASLYANAGGSNSRVRARITFSRGLDILGSTGGPHPLASRTDGSAIFSKLEAWVAYDTRISSRFSLALQAEGQIASRPLLSSEEMGLGGRYFLRGYDFREFSGDKGITASAELRFDLGKTPKPINSAQLYLYGDAGTVGNYQGGFGSGSLASAGGGVRVRIADRFDASMEIGVPLRRGFDPEASRKPRLSFTVGASF